VIRRILVSASALAAVTALLLLVIGAVFCRMTLRPYRRIGPCPRNAATITIRARDGVKLSAWWLQSQKPNGNCVAVLHGIADYRVSAQGFAPMFLDAGYSVLLNRQPSARRERGRFRHLWPAGEI